MAKTTQPPRIYSNQVKLFGPEGTEYHEVKNITFYDCNAESEECVHRILMKCKSKTSSVLLGPLPRTEFVYFENVSYEDLVELGYVKFFLKLNQSELLKSAPDKCKLVKIPFI